MTRKRTTTNGNCRYVKIGEAAKRLDIKVERLRYMSKIGWIQIAKLSPAGHRLYDIREINGWIDAE